MARNTWPAQWAQDLEEEYDMPIEEILRSAVDQAKEVGQTQASFAEECGVHPGTVRNALRRYGLRWPYGIKSIDLARESPWARLYITYRGRRQTLTSWADELGVPKSRLYYRIKHGWDPVKALTKPPESREEKIKKGAGNLTPGWKGYRRG